MRDMRVLAALLILSIVSACASEPRSHVERRLGDASTTSPKSYAEAVETLTDGVNNPDMLSARQDLVPAVHRGEREPQRYDDPIHYHEEPSPEAKHAAEAALILTGSVFLCTFVVVVLDGACNFGVGFGYHYY